MDKVKTLKKSAILPVLAVLLSSLTYKYVQSTGISSEIYTGVLISILVVVKDVLKHKFKVI